MIILAYLLFCVFLLALLFQKIRDGWRYIEINLNTFPRKTNNKHNSNNNEEHGQHVDKIAYWKTRLMKIVALPWRFK